VENVRGVDVVEKAPEAPQQPWVLVARNAGADQSCRQRGSRTRPRPAPAPGMPDLRHSLTAAGLSLAIGDVGASNVTPDVAGSPQLDQIGVGVQKIGADSFRGVHVAQPPGPDRHLDPLCGTDLQTQVTSPREARARRRPGAACRPARGSGDRERPASRGPGRPCRGAGSPRRRPRRG